MKINLVGNIFGIDGYSSHCKQFFNALYKLNTDIKLDVPLPPDWARYVNDAELNAITRNNRKADVTIAITTPPFWRLAMDNGDKFVGFCVWEGDRIPEYWLNYLMDERVNQVWVPSHHTRSAILFSGELANIDNEKLMNKIRIVPHGVDLSIFNSQVSSDRKDEGVDNSLLRCTFKAPDIFTFFCNKGWRGGMEDRGGVGYVLKAFAEEFKKEEKVRLLLKLNPAYMPPQNVITELDKLNLPKNRAEIVVNCDNIPYKEMPDLYHQSDIYVCAQRADAWNLPGTEAMACGLPTIQTAFGGQCDYMTEKDSWFIRVKEMKQVEGDINYEEVNWAIPDVENLKGIMRHCFENQKEVKEKGKKALENISKFTWHNSAQKALGFLNKLNCLS